jgi:hypothetical protein
LSKTNKRNCTQKQKYRFLLHRKQINIHMAIKVGDMNKY